MTFSANALRALAGGLLELVGEVRRTLFSPWVFVLLAFALAIVAVQVLL